MSNTTLSSPVIVTGLSGAGLSSVLKTLEDFGFEAFDNFPLSLVEPLLQEQKRSGEPADTRVAIGIDTRTRGFSPDSVLAAVKAANARLLFITCDDGILQKRFTETRRRHPLAKDRSVAEGIKQERELLEPLRNKADFVMDTSDFSIHDLRHVLEGYFDIDRSENITISLISFGFRHGVPREADLVMDVRFLQNPHWVKELKPYSGLDQEVGDYIEQDDQFDPFLTRFKTLIEPLLPRYAQEGKSYLTIAVGCTGGRHRSVYTAEKLAPWLDKLGYKLSVEHRDLNKSSLK